MGVELIVWGILIAYAVLWLVTWVAWVRRFEREWGWRFAPDSTDRLSQAAGGFVLGLMWPVTLPVYWIMESNGGFVADLFFPEAAGKRKREEKRREAIAKAEEYDALENKYRGYRNEAKAEGKDDLAAAMDETSRMFGQLAHEMRQTSYALY